MANVWREKRQTSVDLCNKLSRETCIRASLSGMMPERKMSKENLCAQVLEHQLNETNDINN